MLQPGPVPAREEHVRAAVIGAGEFGTGIVTQSAATDGVDVCVVADTQPESARRAYRLAGFADDDIAECESRDAALSALEKGQRVVLTDALLAMDLPLDVIAEATGAAEAGALHARQAIRHGLHVVMVNKEADAAVGPILRYMADREGVAYLPADGDQHGLLIGLVEWARRLGLEVVCGGKARVGEFVLEEDADGLCVAGVRVDADRAPFFRPIPAGRAEEFVHMRRETLSELRQAGPYDLEELVIAANATGLLPDVERSHCPVLRTREIPEALCPRAAGGILGRTGAVEIITCLRRPEEAGLGGGVFIVVGCANDYSRSFITKKGLISNASGMAGLMIRPYHLCGVETPASILAAALGGASASPTDCCPRVDLVVRAAQNLRAGRRVDADGLDALQAEMHPARPLTPGAPLPFRLALPARLTRDVPAGELVTLDAVEPPADSVLWDLRRQQDALLA